MTSPVDGDPKVIVRNGYDTCGVRYNATRTGDRGSELRPLIDALPATADVLDIGCGGGHPVTLTLSRHASVTGVDVSPVQIAEARKALPNVRLIQGDIASLEFDDGSFDAIVSFYTLFHLPRDEHQPVLASIARWLKPGGHLLVTVANTAHPGYTERDFCGVTMFWSHFESAWYVAVLEELGFEILRQGLIPGGCYDSDHPILFARVTGGSDGSAV
jgi:SAM-dependent methyltransferase